MPTNDEIIQKNKELINLWYGSFHMHYLKDLRILMNQARDDQTIKLKSKFRNILHAFANDPDKSFKHIDEILKNIEVD